MTRLISGVVLGAAALAAVLYLPALGLRVVACVVAALAAREYVLVVRHARHAAEMSVVVVLVVLTCWLMTEATPFTLVLLLLGGLALVAFEVLYRGYPIDRAAVSFLAPWYLGMPLGMLVVIHVRGGRAATLLLLGTIVISDSAQYYSGRLFGRHQLARTISPKKTLEGALGGLVCGALVMAIVGPRVLPQAGRASLAFAGITLVVLGVCGDLFESRLKRTAGMKDSSSLIPGHGGVLDRIDALLFATPAFYVYLTSLT
jgi:phosphatidate cytidylyltransferase